MRASLSHSGIYLGKFPNGARCSVAQAIVALAIRGGYQSQEKFIKPSAFDPNERKTNGNA